MMRTRMLVGLTAALAAVGMLTLLATMAVAQNIQSLPIGQTVSGEVANRLGEEWTFEACAGDVVTVTMTSADFSTFLELYAPEGRNPIATSDGGATGSDAEIGGLQLADTGVHTIVAAGSGILDRGPYSLTLVISGTTDLTGLGASILSDTVPVTGVVSTRLGDEWLFRGCESQAVTLTMQSGQFAPILEIYNSTDREPLAVGAETDITTTVQISGFVLPRNDLYAVIAAGTSLRDRGPYTLSLIISETAAVTPTATVTPTQTGTATQPSATATTATAGEPTCSVVSASLNLRPGPGTEFAPPVGALLQGAELRPLSRNADGSWIEVEVVSNGRRGWVSAAPQFVSCNIGGLPNPAGIVILPPGVIPPTPTATNTPLPTATPRPTATPPPTATTDPFAGLPTAAGVAIASPGGTGDLAGDVYTDPQIVIGTDARNGTPIFNQYFYLEAFAFDPNIPGNNSRSGVGVDHVDFTIRCPNGEQYNHRENTARYCLFGGGEPSCNVLRLEDGATIPGSQCVIENELYTVDIEVFPTNPNLRTASWSLNVLLEPPGTEQTPPDPQEPPEEPPQEQPQEPPQEQPPADLFAQIVRTGVDSNGDSVSGALVFQVQAYDPSVGNYDGAGIDYVDLYVARPDGSAVYGKRENDAAYCAFGGDEPCPAFDPYDNGNQWPGGAEFTPGPYRLVAQVTADDGRTLTIERTVNIQ